MKRKILLILALSALLVCMFAVSAGAAALTNYASVELTLVDGTKTTGYCVVDGRFQRDNVYKNPENTDDGTYDWGDIKVFDMRDSVIVGNRSYSEVAGLNCNNQAVNVEEFYFSSQVTRILNTSFTSGWQSLKTVYIPNTVTSIDYDSFKQSVVERVVFEEGSQLKSIGDNAFRGCSNLTTFDFPEGLESLGYNCFWQSGLSGTIVIPNSVTFLDAGSLLSTEIENLYLGDGALKIGHNFLGTYGQTDNAYLKNVYISASTTFTQSNIFYKCANLVNFYIVGSAEECAAMINTLKAQSAGQYITFITEGEAKELGINEENGAGYAIIHTEYNRCQAFYNGKHAESEKTQKFEGEAYLSSYCEFSDCPRCGEISKVELCAPLFENKGFSAAEYAGGGMSLSFKADKTAIEKYEKITGETVRYGVFAVLADKIGTNDIFDADGKALAGAIAADITGTCFNLFSLKMTGFTEAQKKLPFAMGAFVGTEKDGTTEYSYLQIAAPAEGEKYYFASYNDVIKLTPNDDENV